MFYCIFIDCDLILVEIMIPVDRLESFKYTLSCCKEVHLFFIYWLTYTCKVYLVCYSVSHLKLIIYKDVLKFYFSG